MTNKIKAHRIKIGCLLVNNCLPYYRKLSFHLEPAFQSTVTHCSFYVDYSHDCKLIQSHYVHVQQVH